MNNKGEIETTTKLIPLVSTETLSVVFHPEGGRLGCDVENTVYFASSNSHHESVPITGKVQDGRGRSQGVVTMGTDGRGVIRQLVCKQKESLTLLVETPLSFKGQQFTLPMCESIPVLSAEVKQKEVHVVIQTATPSSEEYAVELFRLNHLIEQRIVKLTSTQTTLMLPVSRQYGVLRVLLKKRSASEFSPTTFLQERLVFLFPPEETEASLSLLTEPTVDVSQSIPVQLESAHPASMI